MFCVSSIPSFQTVLFKKLTTKVMRTDVSFLHLQCIFVDTRYASSQSHKGNGIDRVLKKDEATKMAGNVTNDCSADSNAANGYNKAGVTVANSCFVLHDVKLYCI